MQDFDREEHWDNIYSSKDTEKVSWYQPSPDTSLEFIDEAGIPETAKIIDIGGGDSSFALNLLKRGYRYISVLDVSINAIDKGRQRLGGMADKVRWIHADAARFDPPDLYDFWHDRAAFHFLTDEREIQSYISTAETAIKPGGWLVMGTFSEEGPEICSGIRIRQYSEKSLEGFLGKAFERIRCMQTDHTTPSGSVQNFLFCSFRKK
jgi:SAM-dependent methyltransferase